MKNIQLTRSTVAPYSEKVILKLLFEHHLFEDFKKEYRRNNKLGSALGLPPSFSKNETLPSQFEDLLRKRLEDINTEADAQGEWNILERNVLQIGALLQLSECEVALFRLSAYAKINEELKTVLGYVSGSFFQCASILTSLLGFDKKEIKFSLREKGKLYQYDLIGSKYHNPTGLDDYLKYGDMIEINDLMLFDLDKSALLKHCLKEAPKPTLTKNDFDHLAMMRDKLQHHLQSSLANQKVGTNILIWGKPGTGKTELALYLNQSLGVDSYLLNYEDDDGDTIKPIKRLNHCSLSQKLLGKQQAVIIFDEIEDVFCGNMFERSAAQENKAWVNQLLENNSVPIIWLSNSVHTIDEAFLRRFDFIFEMPDMPLVKKTELILHLSNQKLSLAYAQHFAKHKGISNALATRAFSVLNHESEQLSAENFGESVQNWFNETLKAQGYPALEKINLQKIDYNLGWVNCSENLQQISQGLIRNKAGRICCYGPAGTGKTEWANWIAQQADRQVLVKRGSDLMGKYVGETEQNIAQAFRQAQENNMVLVLDEVDTFLFNRAEANRSWERSMVNEMLTQIERFEGLMIVSTNLMDNLEPAVLRRFDVKMKFDFLMREQICNVAKDQAEKLGLSLKDTDFMQLESLKYLTLGDFAAITRRHRFAPFEQSEDWIQALAQECELKNIRKPKSIGFI